MQQRTYLAISVGIVLRVLVGLVILGGVGQVDDGPSFARQASEIVDGTIGSFYFPPGTALSAVPFAAMFGPSEVAYHIVGTLTSIAVLLSTVWLAVTLTGWGRATLITAWIAALYPHTILASTQLSSHMLAAALVTSATALALRCTAAWSWSRWLGVCFLVSAAILTRPATAPIVLVLLAAAIVLVRRRTIAVSTMAGATSMLVLVLGVCAYPVMRQNALHGQGWTLSTNNEWNLFLANTPYTPDYKTGHFGQRNFSQLDSTTRAYLDRFLPHESPSNATLAERQAMRTAALDYMRTHPLRTLYRVSNRLRGYWGMDYTMARMLQNTYGLSNAAFAPLVVLEGGAYCLVLLLALSAPFLVQQPLGSGQTFLLGIIVAGMAPYLVAFSLAKYHMTAIPIVMIAAAVTISATSDGPRAAWAQLRGRPLWWVVVVALVALQAEHVYHLIVLR